MRKKIKFYFLVFLFSFVLIGCGKDNSKDIINKLDSKIKNANSYYVDGVMEIINNEDTYTYDVKVSYKKDNYYKVDLVNTLNNHEQVILKNEDGVYVITPSLNKSFKFQSDWPYNNSQVYLIQSIIDDIKKDNERSLVSNDSNYIFTSNVNYPNNRKLIKQIVTFDKDYNLKSVSVVDENDVSSMKISFQTINLKPDISKDTFDLNKIMGSSEIENKKEEATSKLDDIIYPLYLPTGTVLANSEKVNKDDGERVIMTFEGEKPFLLVEETASTSEDFSVVPTYGEPYLLIDTVAALSNNSINWVSNGIEYYIVSDVMNQNELIEVAKSVNVVSVLK